LSTITTRSSAGSWALCMALTVHEAALARIGQVASRGVYAGSGGPRRTSSVRELIPSFENTLRTW
jgi:hypothetical protein